MKIFLSQSWTSGSAYGAFSVSTVSATRDEQTETDISEGDEEATDSKNSYSGGYGDCTGNEDFSLIHVKL